MKQIIPTKGTVQPLTEPEKNVARVFLSQVTSHVYFLTVICTVHHELGPVRYTDLKPHRDVIAPCFVCAHDINYDSIVRH